MPCSLSLSLPALRFKNTYAREPCASRFKHTSHGRCFCTLRAADSLVATGQTSLAVAPRSSAPSASLAPLALQFMRSALWPGHAGGICHKMNLKAFSFILWPVLPCFWLNPYHSMNEDPLIFILWPANEYVRVWLRTRKDSGCLLRPLVDKFSWLFS